jgi:hypothetical protein
MTPRIRSISASEAQQIFREFMERLGRLQQPARFASAPRPRSNGHLRANGHRRTRERARRRP